MQKKINDGILTFLYIVILAFAIVIINANYTHFLTTIYLFLSFIVSFTIRNVLIYNSDYNNRFQSLNPQLKKITFVIELLLILIILLLTQNLVVIFLNLVILVDLILHSSKKREILASIVIFVYSILISLTRINQIDSRNILIFILIYTLLYLIVWIISTIIKYMINQNEIIDLSYKNLTVKNCELETLYQKLMQAYEQLEETTILKERHHVARELHDTIGHTVTKALISVEATKVLLLKEPIQALEKLTSTEESLRDGLADIRKVLHLLDRKPVESDLNKEIQGVITSIMDQTGVYIASDIADVPIIDQRQKRNIVRILQEGLTNGLKHGEATAFYFKLSYADKKVHFLLSDNGRGNGSFNKGFGLINMEERVRELNGEIKFESTADEGFSIDICFPFIRSEKIE